MAGSDDQNNSLFPPVQRKSQASNSPKPPGYKESSPDNASTIPSINLRKGDKGGFAKAQGGGFAGAGTKKGKENQDEGFDDFFSDEEDNQTKDVTRKEKEGGRGARGAEGKVDEGGVKKKGLGEDKGNRSPVKKNVRDDVIEEDFEDEFDDYKAELKSPSPKKSFIASKPSPTRRDSHKDSPKKSIIQNPNKPVIVKTNPIADPEQKADYKPSSPKSSSPASSQRKASPKPKSKPKL